MIAAACLLNGSKASGQTLAAFSALVLNCDRIGSDELPIMVEPATAADGIKQEVEQSHVEYPFSV